MWVKRDIQRCLLRRYFTIEINQNLPKCPSVQGWVNKIIAHLYNKDHT